MISKPSRHIRSDAPPKRKCSRCGILLSPNSMNHLDFCRAKQMRRDQRDLVDRRERTQYPLKAEKRAKRTKPMTVCVAALCDDGRTIITASDTMITMLGETADRSVVKLSSIGHWWTAMLAGDLNKGEMIVRRAMLEDMDEMPSLEDICERLESSYQYEMERESVSRILSIFGIRDMDTFRKEGLSNFGASGFAELKRKVALVQDDFGVALIVFGFDADGRGHLITVEAPGVASVHDQHGYASIGTGADAALSQLVFRKQANTAGRRETLHRVCEAKFRAEASDGVGAKTMVYVLGCRGESPFGRISTFLPQVFIEQAKDIWTSQMAEHAPEWSDSINHYFEPAS